MTERLKRMERLLKLQKQRVIQEEMQQRDLIQTQELLIEKQTRIFETMGKEGQAFRLLEAWRAHLPSLHQALEKIGTALVHQTALTHMEKRREKNIENKIEGLAQQQEREQEKKELEETLDLKSFLNRIL